MNRHLFKFKKFSILQEKSAMKVGTDGVLLGAWANTENPLKILDIGTGTGLILLMLAQRFPDSELTGIEIDKNSFEEANFNVSKSIFDKRCKIILASLQEFDPQEKFDLIVSNPPFFELTHRENSSRNTARQQSDLTFEELLFHTEKLLSHEGKFALIIPFESENYFKFLASKFNLFPNKITRIKGNKNTQFKRSLLLLSRIQSEIKKDELIIEISRNNYTPDYISLTKDFYLKM